MTNGQVEFVKDNGTYYIVTRPSLTYQVIENASETHILLKKLI